MGKSSQKQNEDVNLCIQTVTHTVSLHVSASFRTLGYTVGFGPSWHKCSQAFLFDVTGNKFKSQGVGEAPA